MLYLTLKTRFDALLAGARGKAMQRILDDSDNPQLVRILMRVLNVSTGKVVGTPGSMRSFRSKVYSATIVFGSMTCFPTYNPSEMHAEPVMRLGGRPFQYDAAGVPSADRPGSTERRAIVASHPAACAVFYQANMRAVRVVAYGWRDGSPRQTDVDCLFGQVRLPLVV